jgi:hypothetical protein
MRDEYDARLWNEGRQDTNKAIDGLINRIMQAFCVLHRIHWSSPWTAGKTC